MAGRAGGFCLVELLKIVLISCWKTYIFLRCGVVQGGKSNLVETLAKTVLHGPAANRHLGWVIEARGLDGLFERPPKIVSG